MLLILNEMRGLGMAPTAIRMALAILCGGLIGIEREYKRRPAGFRTHILICLGAAMMTMTGQFLSLELNYPTDISRLGAQVVAGIGFIGAGTIIVTQHQRVKGLTTAAGLWASAVVGLAVGAGFYEGGILATFLILLAETVFSKLEFYVMRHTPEINLYVQYSGREALEDVFRLLHTKNVKVQNVEITRDPSKDPQNVYALFLLQMDKKKYPADLLITDLQSIRGIQSVEEI